MPKISVLMPVYNCENYLKEAVDSILNQTFTDFELLLINDGSTDKSEDVILSYDDSRIRYIKNEKNLGLIKTLNKGIKLANGEYIARMDGDDISEAKRFAKQVEILDNYQNIIAVSTHLKEFGASDVVFKGVNNPLSFIVSSTMICHAPVMLRSQVLLDNNVFYNIDYPHAEDYKLWNDLKHFGEFYVIDEVLYYYRIHSESVSRKHSDIQQASRAKVNLEEYQKLVKRDLKYYEIAILSEQYYKASVNQMGEFVKTIKFFDSKLSLDKTIVRHLRAQMKTKKDILTLLKSIRSWNILPLIKFLLKT